MNVSLNDHFMTKYVVVGQSGNQGILDIRKYRIKRKQDKQFKNQLQQTDKEKKVKHTKGQTYKQTKTDQETNIYGELNKREGKREREKIRSHIKKEDDRDNK